ncbi:MAG: hypothetical protein ACRETO_04125 [Gammaproteobacteria bacterium]
MNTAKLDLSDGLTTHVQALSAQQPDAGMLDAAQRKLNTALDEREAKHASRGLFGTRGLAYAGLAAALAIVGVLAPTLFTSQGSAFAAVQARLRDFTTLTMTITQRANGIDLPTIQVWTNRKGDAHTDIGDTTSVIVNQSSGTILTLLHPSHQAMRMTITQPDTTHGSHALDWLKSVQKFKGKATLLPGSKVIDGMPTQGWSLNVSGMHIVLWADRDGVPRAVNIIGDQGSTYSQHIKLSMDTPIDAARFSTELPTGYTLMNGKEDRQ